MAERTPRVATGRLRRRARRTLVYVFALGVLAIVVIPLLFAILGGFRDNAQLVTDPVGLPDPWVTTNYRDIASSTTFWRQVANSTLIAGIATAVVLPAASLAAFALARYTFAGREAVYTLFTLGLLFPVAVAILPLFIVLRQTDLLSNPLGVALPAGRVRAPALDRDHATLLPGRAPRAAGCCRDRWLHPAPLLLVDHAAVVAPGAEHDRRAHHRHELERVPPPACSC